jgi:hypothetical protein
MVVLRSGQLLGVIFLRSGSGKGKSSWLASSDGIVSIMLIERVGDAYERRGLGEILQTSVEHSLKPEPRWEEIILG